jgi:hypothetical protein
MTLFFNSLVVDSQSQSNDSMIFICSGAWYLYKFMRTKKYWVHGIHKVRVIDGKIR